MPRAPALTTALLALTALPPRPALAGDEVSAPVAYGVAALELSTAALLAVQFGTDLGPTEGAGLALNFAPLVLAPLAAWGAHAGDLDARPALALHGATWLGADLFLLGALIDGRHDGWSLRAGPAAITLGVVGAVAGGVLGATQVDDAEDQLLFSALPVAGFVGGGLVIGGALALATADDGGEAITRLGTGALVGTTVGLGLWAALDALDADAGRDAATPRVTPSVSGPGRRFLLSFGGAF